MVARDVLDRTRLGKPSLSRGARRRDGEPAERIAAWCTARLVESALWSVSRGALDGGQEAMARAAVTSRLAG